MFRKKLDSTKFIIRESALEKEYNKKYEGVDVETLPDRIADTFVGKTVFVTGGTGFMGKVFVEKLLRSCPDLKRMYLLMRIKKGVDPKERMHKLFQNPLFDKLKETHGDDIIKKKVSFICGDVSLPDLGMSESDRQILIDEVNYVYHMAATIRFDEPLKKAILLNTRGTKLVLELAKQMKNLQLFLHVSTAYCHLEQKILEEKSYPPLCNPHDLIKTMEWMEDDVAESLTKKILGKYPNTYAFTKNLSEALVVEAIESDPPFPAVISRPSIVVPIWREPLPGWTDNINGPTGLLIGAGKGVIRTMYCKQEGYADYLPVDIAVNGLMVVSWMFVGIGDVSRRYFHFTSSEEIRVSWEELIILGRKVTEQIPLNGVVWYPGGSMKKSRLFHNICVLLFHTIPAYIIDTLIFFAGYKPIMCRVQRRITKGFEVFEYYANNQWQFMNTHVYFARSVMNPKERMRYKVDGLGLDIEEYFKDCILAARKYILNEAPETLPAARRHLRVMYWVDIFTKIGLAFLFFYFLSQYFDIVHFFFYGLLHAIAYGFSAVFDFVSDLATNR